MRWCYKNGLECTEMCLCVDCNTDDESDRVWMEENEDQTFPWFDSRK